MSQVIKIIDPDLDILVQDLVRKYPKLHQALTTKKEIFIDFPSDFKRVVDIRDYPVKGNGSDTSPDDDYKPLARFFKDVQESDNRVGLLGNRTFASSLPLTITADFTRIYAAGATIKRIGANTDPVFTVTQLTDGLHSYAQGIHLDGIKFDANSIATHALKWLSCRYGYADVQLLGSATTSGVEVGSQLGGSFIGARDPQYNDFKFVCIQDAVTAGWGAITTGPADGSADTGLNQYWRIDVLAYNKSGVVVFASDRETFHSVRVYMITKGPYDALHGPYSMEFRGNDVEGASARNCEVKDLSATDDVNAPYLTSRCYAVDPDNAGAAVAHPARNIIFRNLDRGNATLDPIIDTGASAWASWDRTPIHSAEIIRTTGITVVSTGGTITSLTSAGVEHLLTVRGIRVTVIIIVNVAGTGSGSVHATMPFTIDAAVTISDTIITGINKTTGIQCTGRMAAGSNIMEIKDANGAYPFTGNTQTIIMDGELRTQDY